jgi:hypothetical protein
MGRRTTPDQILLVLVLLAVAATLLAIALHSADPDPAKRVTPHHALVHSQ